MADFKDSFKEILKSYKSRFKTKIKINQGGKMKKSRLVSFVVFGCQLFAIVLLLASVVSAGSVPYSFSSGSLIKSSDMNSNFSWLAERAWEKNGSNLYFNSGDVGLGTTSPQYTLDLKGDISIDSNSSINGSVPIRILNNQMADGNVFHISIGKSINNENGFHINYTHSSIDTNRKISIGTMEGWGGSENFTMLGNGNVGIGTLTPSQKLSVAGTIESTTGGFKFPDGTIQATAATGSSTSTSTTSTGWTESGGNIYRTSGFVGIGTQNPGAILHVVGNDVIFSDANRNQHMGFQIYDGKADIRTSYLGTGPSLPLTFSTYYNTSMQERVRIDITGNVGIGTTNPQGKLDVNGTIYQRGAEIHADYVFEPEYQLETIEEHANFMWQEKHLKAVPAAKKDENGQDIVEYGTHMKGILEELEKAHVYIAQLNEVTKKQQQIIEELNERLKTLENKQ